jgi:hypothetical protein
MGKTSLPDRAAVQDYAAREGLAVVRALTD